MVAATAEVSQKWTCPATAHILKHIVWMKSPPPRFEISYVSISKICMSMYENENNTTGVSHYLSKIV